MRAKRHFKNGSLSYVISTNQNLNAKKKTDLILGEVRLTSDYTCVLNSRCKQGNIVDADSDSRQELAALVQDKATSEEANEVFRRFVCIVPKLWNVKPFALKPPSSDGLLNSFMKGNRDDIWSLTSVPVKISKSDPQSDTRVRDLKIISTTEKDKFLLMFERVDKNIFRLDFVYPFSPMQAFAICLARFGGK